MSKFTKLAAYYVAKPKIVRPFTCDRCRYFIQPDRCQIVSEEGFPSPGKIEPKGTCTFWNDLGFRQFYIRILFGYDGHSGLLPGTIRNRFVQFVQEKTSV